LKNDFTERCCSAQIAEKLPREEDAARYFAALEEGDPSQAAIFVGEAAGLIRDIAPAAVLVERIAGEAEKLLGERAPAFVS
ncbi:MAG TPA: nitronate monooxygenase, partial [Hyphomicrobiales bacterium]|nr:nitronate monooxygenase [Hyphomicrobiales bacterium]